MKITKEMIYTDRTDIDDFLNCENKDEAEFNRAMYEILLTCGKYHSASSLKALNAAYCQCTYAVWLDHPESELTFDTLFGEYKNANIWDVRTITWALLSVLPKRSFEINLLIKRLERGLFNTFPNEYKDSIYNFVHSPEDPHHDSLNINLSPNPQESMETFEDLDKCMDWNEATDEFNCKAIRKIISLWRTQEEQLWILDAIERDYDRYLAKKEEPDEAATAKVEVQQPSESEMDKCPF